MVSETRTARIAWLFSIGLMVLSVSVVYGQDFPNKPIRIVTGNVGGGNDFVARVIASGLADFLGQSVIVENRGTALISFEVVAKATPDGYTLLVTGGSLWITPLFQKTSYDPVRDFAPITAVSKEPSVLVVHPSVPVKSVKELIALARARPGELNYASAPPGSSSYHVGELFRSMAGINIVFINYKGGAAQINDLLGGHVQLTFSSPAAVAQHIKSGKIRALAVTSAEPSALFPGLPTVAATVPGYEVVSTSGMFAPAKTPVANINRLNQEIVRVLNQTDLKQKFLNSGVEAAPSTLEELAAVMKSDMAKVGKVIKDVGIKVE